ncbi:MAG: hypothetical protein ACMUIL_02230 [bacterium]
MPEVLTIRIGDVSIAIDGERVEGNGRLLSSYSPFIGNGRVDIRLRLHCGIPDNFSMGERVFACPPMWTLYRRDGSSIITICNQGAGLERALVLSPEIDEAQLYIARETRFLGDPFYGPTMELLLLHYLSRGRGAILHACAVNRKGKGILFIGESGAGKSTLAGIWQANGAGEVVSDDRAIVRTQGNRFRMYGTPWHGDARLGLPGGVPLTRIFFLRHGSVNAVKDLAGIDPVARLLTCSFLPHWDPQGVTFGMDFFTGLAARVPCQELFFKPDRSALHFIEKIMDV